MDYLQLEHLDIPRMLKSEREKRFLSYEQLGREIGCSSAYIFRMEKGTRKKPSYEIVLKIIQFFGLDNDFSMYVGPEFRDLINEEKQTEQECLDYMKKMDCNSISDVQKLLQMIKQYQEA